MIRELAQAVHDLAMTGRLSEESAENIRFILEPPEPVSTEHVVLRDAPPEGNDDNDNDNDDEKAEKAEPAKTASSTAKSTATGGKK